MIKHPSNVREFAANKPAASVSFTLSGSSSGDKRPFSAALSSGDKCPVHATNGVSWMDFIGTFTAPNTLEITTFIDSSTGSAIDWGSGGNVLLEVAWLGLHGEQAARIEETTFKHVVDADGNKFALLPLDANGNVIANIAHRQNTLANLLSLDGLAGEISVATDVDALVVHNGVAGEARKFRKPKYAGALVVTDGALTTIPTATYMYLPLVLTDTSINDSGCEIVTQAGGEGWVYVPRATRFIKVTAMVEYSASSAGTQRLLRLHKGSTIYVSALTGGFNASQVCQVRLTWWIKTYIEDFVYGSFDPGLTSEYLYPDHLKLRVRHDAGVDLTARVRLFSVECYD